MRRQSKINKEEKAQKSYSLATSSPKGGSRHRAPASLHSSSVPLIARRTSPACGSLFLKIHAFLSFQISQAIISMNDFSLFLKFDDVNSVSLCQCLRDVWLASLFSFKAAQPLQADALFQIEWENGQSQNWCIELSRFLLQRTQKYPFGHPHRYSRSLHQSLSWCSSQAIFFTVPGAQAFHIATLIPNVGAPLV